MKFKKITQKVLPVIFSLVLAVGTSITGAGATEEKTYLKDMDYPTIETNLKEEDYDKYSFTEFEGKFNKTNKYGEDIECINAMKLWFDDYSACYITDSSSPLYKGNFASYKITYTLDGKYDEFCADLFTNSPIKIDCEIIGDGARLKMHSITKSSEKINLKINVEDIDTLDINISSPFGSEYIGRTVMFNNAYLTTGEVTEDPTDPIVEPTQPVIEPTNPTVEPTQPIIEPTNPTVEPTQPVTEPTDPTDIPNPTDNPTNPTTPTDNPTNKPNSNIITNNTTTGKTAGTVNTGDTSFIFVALMVIGVAGTATFIVRKVKYSK